jgi:hypothetical protein
MSTTARGADISGSRVLQSYNELKRGDNTASNTVRVPHITGSRVIQPYNDVYSHTRFTALRHRRSTDVLWVRARLCKYMCASHHAVILFVTVKLCGQISADIHTIQDEKNSHIVLVHIIMKDIAQSLSIIIKWSHSPYPLLLHDHMVLVHNK